MQTEENSSVTDTKDLLDHVLRQIVSEHYTLQPLSALRSTQTNVWLSWNWRTKVEAERINKQETAIWREVLLLFRLFRFTGKPSTDIKPSSCASSAISFNQKTSGRFHLLLSTGIGKHCDIFSSYCIFKKNKNPGKPQKPKTLWYVQAASEALH